MPPQATLPPPRLIGALLLLRPLSLLASSVTPPLSPPLSDQPRSRLCGLRCCCRLVNRFTVHPYRAPCSSLRWGHMGGGGGGNGSGSPPSSRPWVDPSAVPVGENLKKYCLDLTELARDGKLDPVIGREDEMRRTIEILSRRSKNNPVLLGEPGVGSTHSAQQAARSTLTHTAHASRQQLSLTHATVRASVLLRGVVPGCVVTAPRIDRLCVEQEDGHCRRSATHSAPITSTRTATEAVTRKDERRSRDN